MNSSVVIGAKFSLHFATFSLHYFSLVSGIIICGTKKSVGVEGWTDGVTWLWTEKLVGLASKEELIVGLHVERDTEGDTQRRHPSSATAEPKVFGRTSANNTLDPTASNG
jgi:hypothetical protein